jgi:thymidylate synthase
MKQYLDIVQHILDRGQWKQNRTGKRALTCPNLFFSHDMSDGFPLLTTRKMPWRSLRVELEGFIRGITSKSWYKNRGCHYWDFWANPQKVQQTILKKYQHVELTPPDNGIAINITDKQHKKEQELEDDLGVIYGFQWRKFDEAYDEDDNGHVEGVDQLKNIVDALHTNPNDRRMICSAWNPHQLSRMALPPCHLLWNVTHINGTLNLSWVQRSVDTMLGLPSNIASYATLLLLLCKESGMQPGNLSALLMDVHIYENLIDGAKQQIQRTPRDLPDAQITTERFFHKNEKFNIFDWTYQDVKLTGYYPYDKIDFGDIAK